MELSDTQFERLVTMLADNRAAIHTAKSALSVEIQQVKKDLALRIEFVAGKLEAVEEDLGKVQKTQREQGALLGSIESLQREHTGVIAQMDQSLMGVTQLAKSNFDMVESINKHLLEGSDTLQHGDTESLDRTTSQ